MTRTSIWLVLGAVVALAGPAHAAPAHAAPAAGGACGRGCLGGLLGRYLAAIVAHDPAQAPIDPSFRQTQNAVVIPRGEGLWRDVAALGPIDRRYFDPTTQTAAYFGLLTLAGGEHAVASLRLHAAAGKVDEAEWHVIRRGDPGISAGEKVLFDADNLVANPPPERVVPPGDRLSRAQLVAIANSYFDGVTNANARIIMAHPGCVRLENGFNVTGRPLPADRADEGPGGKSDCTSGQGRFGVALVAGRRYPLVDEQAQVVLAIATFIRTPNEPRRRNHFMEFFYIDHAKIRTVYATLLYPSSAVPVPNWPPYDGNFPLPPDFGAPK